MNYVSLRFFFEEKETAIEALLYVLKDARNTDKLYTIGSLSLEQIMSSGLLLQGDAEHLISQLQTMPGTVLSYD